MNDQKLKVHVYRWVIVLFLMWEMLKVAVLFSFDLFALHVKNGQTISDRKAPNRLLTCAWHSRILLFISAPTLE